MDGIFGVASKNSCTLDLFFGVDYHSHLGTKRSGTAVYGVNGFACSIHNIENSPFRIRFDEDLDELERTIGIGCISDNEPQPLLIQSHFGSSAITTMGRINNQQTPVERVYENGRIHLLEMSGGRISPTELTAALINQKLTTTEGLLYAQEQIEGSMSILILAPEGIYASRDHLGRTPTMVGYKKDAFCVSFEGFAYINLGYSDYKELGPGEIVYITPESVEQMASPREETKMCSFLWVYYGYPTSAHEGINVETMRHECEKMLAKRDDVRTDIVAGVPDSGVAHAVGYANESDILFARPFIKYTPTWPRSLMPQSQNQRNLIARMKLVPVDALIRDKSLLLIDDSTIRSTQLGETTEFLYQSGAEEVHIRPVCPPLMFGCPYLNFSRSNSELDLIARRVIRKRRGDNVPDDILVDYANPGSQNYEEIVEKIRKMLNFTTLRYHRLDDLVASVGISPCKLCTYCWSGKK